MESSNIEILKEFAKATNRKIVDEKLPYPLTGIRTFRKYKEIIYIPNKSDNTSYFIWFSDPYAKIGFPTIFCGVFIPLPSEFKSKINIRNKNIIDKFNVFSKTEFYKTGNKHFDSKVVISGVINSPEENLLSQVKIQNQLLNALKIEPIINISLNEYKIDFIPELKNTPYLSVINPQNWCLEETKIEKLFEQIEKIKTLIN